MYGDTAAGNVKYPAVIGKRRQKLSATNFTPAVGHCQLHKFLYKLVLEIRQSVQALIVGVMPHIQFLATALHPQANGLNGLPKICQAAMD